MSREKPGIHKQRVLVLFFLFWIIIVMSPPVEENLLGGTCKEDEDCKYLVIVDIGHAREYSGATADLDNLLEELKKALPQNQDSGKKLSLSGLLTILENIYCISFIKENFIFVEKCKKEEGDKIKEYSCIKEKHLNGMAAYFLFHEFCMNVEKTENVDILVVETESENKDAAFENQNWCLNVVNTNMDLSGIESLTDLKLCKAETGDDFNKIFREIYQQVKNDKTKEIVPQNSYSEVFYRATLEKILIKKLKEKRVKDKKSQYKKVALVSLHHNSVDGDCQNCEGTLILHNGTENSKDLAKKIENELKYYRKSTTDYGDFVVTKNVKGLDCNPDAAVLVEYAFICNPNELVYLLLSRDFAQGSIPNTPYSLDDSDPESSINPRPYAPRGLIEISRAVANGIIEYLDNPSRDCEPGGCDFSAPGNDHPDEISGVSFCTVNQLQDAAPEQPPYRIDYGTSVFVLSRGYTSGIYEHLSIYRHFFDFSTLNFSPSKIIGEFPVFILPSGSLFSIENSDLFKTRFETYVKNGGTLIVFSQQQGEDYHVLPRGDEITCYGWRQDISCNLKSAAMTSYSPLFSGQDDVVLDLNIDGFFTRIPEDSTVFLARTRDGSPCLFSYPFGEGKVVVSSLYLDFAWEQGSGTTDEEILLRDLIDWSVLGSPPSFMPDQPIELPVEIPNNSSKEASRVIFTVTNPRKEKIEIIDKNVIIQPNQQEETTLTIDPLPLLGYYTVDCYLLDEDYNLLNLHKCLTTFVVSNLVGNESGYSNIPEFGFAITSEKEHYARETPAVFTFHIWNRSSQDRTIFCRFSLPHHYIGLYWINPVERQIFAPQGQETVFTYTLPAVYTFDRVWAEFYDESGNFIGAANRGFYCFSPWFDIELRTNKASYGREDTVTVSAMITNREYDVAANVKFTAKSWSGDELYSTTRPLQFEPHKTKEEIFQFVVPAAINYKPVLIEVEMICPYCHNKAYKYIPVMKSTLSVDIDTSKIGQNQILVIVTNTGEFLINDGDLTLDIDRDGEEFFTESRGFTLAPSETKTLTFNVPFEEGNLSVYTIVAKEPNYRTGKKKEFDAQLNTSISLLSETLKITQNLEGTVLVENPTPFSRSLHVEIWVDNLDFYEQHQLTLGPYERQGIPFTHSLPSDVLWGHYDLECKITIGDTCTTRSGFNILPPSINTILNGDTFEAGAIINVSATNTGGCPSKFNYKATLTDREGNIMLFEEGSSDIWVDETINSAFMIPQDLAEGYYFFAFEGEDLRLNNPFQTARVIKITGKKAILSVNTSKEIYFTDEDVHCLAELRNQDGTVNGSLLLEIIQNAQGDDWWTFRHDLRNTGASSLTSNMENFTINWDILLDWDISSSPVIRDINNDGIAEIVVVSDDGVISVIEGENGSLLWTYETFESPPFPSAPALEDADGDGAIDIIVNGDQKVRVLTNTGQLKWEFGYNPNPSNPWWFSELYNSPVVTDLDGDGSKEIILTFQHALVVLDGETGNEVWHAEGWFGYSTPAIADLGSDNTLEIIVGQGSWLQVYSSSGTLLWDYQRFYGILTPVVADLDGDNHSEIVVMSKWGDFSILSEDGTEILEYTSSRWGAGTPAVGDIDGDGQLEIVISFQNGVVAVEPDGTDLWELYFNPYFSSEYFSSLPALADLNEDGRLDVVVQSDQRLFLLDGTTGNIIWSEYGIYGDSSPAIADADGDGKAEIIVCEKYGTVYCIGSVDLKSMSLPRGKTEEKVLWSTTVPVSLEESQSMNLDYLAGIEAEGLLLLRGTLTASNGQVLATDQYYFYMYPGGMAVTIDTDQEVYWPDEQVQIWGEIINHSQNSREGDLIVSVGDQELLNIPFNLLPGESMPYSTSFVCNSETTIYAMANSTVAQKILHVETPQVFCEIRAPDVVDHTPFRAALRMTNTGEKAVSLDVSFYGYESLTLLPKETIIVNRDIQISEDTILSAVISGDVSQAVQKEVIMGEKVSININPESSYSSGAVEIPFSLSNSGILDSVIPVEFQLDSVFIEREYVINPGNTVQDVLSFTIGEGYHHLTVKTPFEELHFDIEGTVVTENQAELQADIPLVTEETLSFAITVRNTADNTFVGRIDIYTPFWAESIDVEVETEKEYSVNIPTDPGVFLLRIDLICGGEIVDGIEQEIQAVHPLPALQVLSEPSGSYQAGEEAIMNFTVENTGGAGTCEFFFDIPGIESQEMLFSMTKGEIKDISIKVFIPEDIPTGDYTGIYRIDGPAGEFDFHIDGVSVAVSAALDRTVYGEGDTATLTVSVAPSGSYYLKADHGDYHTEIEFEGVVSIPIPVSETGDVFFGVYDAKTMRSLYLSSILLQVRGEFSIYTDKLVYSPGDVVEVAVETNEPGILEVHWDTTETYEVSDTLQFSLVLPLNSINETIQVYYNFIGEDTFIYSSFPVKVEGRSVKVYQCTLDKKRYNPSDTVHSCFVFNSNMPIEGIFEARIVDPEGNTLSEYEAPISLYEKDNDLSLDLSFSTTFTGSHSLEYMVSTSGIVLVSAVKYFDVRGPVILGVSTDKYFYREGEPVRVYVDVYGEGSALLSVGDGSSVMVSRALNLSGIETQEFELSLPEGNHMVKAELHSPLKSTAYTYVVVFSVVSEAIQSSLEQPEVDIRPLAQYHIEQAEQLKEKAESLLEQARDKGVNIDEIEKLYDKANEYLETAKAFLMTVPTTANNWALQAIEVYGEVIKLLEDLLAQNG